MAIVANANPAKHAKMRRPPTMTPALYMTVAGSHSQLMRWIAAGMLLSACSVERPQLVVIVDTDAHLVIDVGSRPDVSIDSAIDTLRVDMLDSANVIYATQQFVVAESSQWPVSFGIVPTTTTTKGGAVRVRLRAFRGRFAHAGVVLGSSTLDPPAEVTIDRLVDLAMPVDGPRRVKVMLAMDCLGTRPSFATPPTTCIDGATLAGDPSQGVTDATKEMSPTNANTWSPAIEHPCTLPVEPPRICIKGGFSILGDETLSGIEGQPETRASPLRPVVLAPFALDPFEYTVGRFRALVARVSFDAEMPRAYTSLDPNDKYCTWRGPSDPVNDALPLNCVRWPSAKRICELEGGALPTEAQWEHTARGRGEQRLFPWGNEEPACCMASISRNGPPPSYAECSGVGLEPVGSHLPSPSCNGIGDVSRDGIVDLGGSVSEAVLDSLAAYNGSCWHATGILHDPLCQNANSFMRRGGAWLDGPAIAASALRNPFTSGVTDGFRCAYRGAP